MARDGDQMEGLGGARRTHRSRVLAATAAVAIVVMLAALVFFPPIARRLWYRPIERNHAILVPRLSWWPGPSYCLENGEWESLGGWTFATDETWRFAEVLYQNAGPAEEKAATHFIDAHRDRIEPWIAGSPDPTDLLADLGVVGIDAEGSGDSRWLRITFEEYHFLDHGYQTSLRFEATAGAERAPPPAPLDVPPITYRSQALPLDGWIFEEYAW